MKQDGSFMGTGGYLVDINLSKRLPNWEPMFGQRIRLTYNGIPKTCTRCLFIHREGLACEKRSWEDYANQFKADNPDIDEDTFDENTTANPDNTADHWLGNASQDGNCDGDSGHRGDQDQDQNEDTNEENESVMDNDLTDDEILLFLRENELTEKEMTWLKSLGTKSETEIVRLVGLIMMKRALLPSPLRTSE